MNHMLPIQPQDNVYTLVEKKIFDQELLVKKVCACCTVKKSDFILVQRKGIATVLDHVCFTCLKDLCVLLLKDSECAWAYMCK
jgi:superfamily II helicase